MHRPLRPPLLVLGAAVAAAVLGLASPAVAQQSSAIVVSGEVICSHAGPVGRYQINWTVANNAPTIPVNITVNPASETGTLNGTPYSNTVALTPNQIPANGIATGTDGPIGGTSAGTITLSVSWMSTNEDPVSGTNTGSVTLAGDCVNVDPTTTVRPTTTVAPAVVTSPKFTG